jgi:general stress protein YciG
VNRAEAGRLGGLKSGPKSGKLAVKNKTGIHGMSRRQKRAVALRVGRKFYEEGLGIFARTPEQIHEDSVKAGNSTFEKRGGIFAMSKEEQTAAGKKGGTISGNNTLETKGREHFSKMGTKGSPIGHHIRYHVMRERVPNSKWCLFCDGPRKAIANQ